MAHYAQVINNRVVQVLVADEDKIDEIRPGFEGTLIQTSYNTRDGVHYGSDGKPDGGQALRLNYAEIGMWYNKERDIFYRDTSAAAADAFYLDEATMTCKQVMPNQAVPMRRDRNTEEVFVYVSCESMAKMGGQTKDNLEASLNLVISQNEEKASIALPLSNEEVRLFSVRPEFKQSRPITSRQLLNLTDRLANEQLRVRPLPTWAIPTPDDLLKLPPAPLSLVRQRTHREEQSPFAGLQAATPQALFKRITDISPSFWATQGEGDEINGAFVVQPAIPRPYRDLVIRFSVNAQSEIHVWSVTRTAYNSFGTPVRMLPHHESVDDLCELISADVKAKGLKTGFHSARFVNYQGSWRLADWRAHLEHLFVGAFASVYPILDDALLHMLGRPLRHAKDHLHTEVRSYANRQLTRKVAGLVGAAGLFARWKGDLLDSVAGIGIGDREVQARYDALDQQLTVSGASK